MAIFNINLFYFPTASCSISNIFKSNLQEQLLSWEAQSITALNKQTNKKGWMHQTFRIPFGECFLRHTVTNFPSWKEIESKIKTPSVGGKSCVVEFSRTQPKAGRLANFCCTFFLLDLKVAKTYDTRKELISRKGSRWWNTTKLKGQLTLSSAVHNHKWLETLCQC